jgi:serine-protein kinase ATM
MMTFGKTVFEQVSTLLSDHRATRQRKLGIRTYNVVPLITNAGIIEFVQGTVPLHDYVLPAHERYFPKDYKSKRCRNEIGDAQSKPLQQRVQAYRNVTANFHPVMRFFFMEKFLDPDEWFYKRLNYSRSSAAISILGHVLGLGDRHGHNILLDQNTGEVVHIDLGVAFEAGRILPVPEVVPFRLTRDLVDAMGISGVEGVFRRCCNFTLEALRQDQESIMTLLDVLRYDPLVSWSISPYRLKKMQEMADASEADGIDGAIGGAARDSDDSNEANRALAVVREKLGKSLSVEAEVNELIRQATDEKNLAVLYSGWGAYA